MKKWVIVSILILATAVGLWTWQKEISGNFIKINGHEIKVEIAKTPATREQGLSGREALCADCGMLFLFEKASNYPFWMKEMKFNLDMLWISGNRVVKVAENVPYAKGTGEIVDPKVLADKVLEINAGQSAKWGIKEGSQIIFSLK